MRRTLAFAAVWVGLAVGTAHGDDGHVLTTEHLRVSGDVRFALVEEAADLGEALVASLTSHFGRAPERLPIELRLYPDQPAMARSLRASGVGDDLTGLGGYMTVDGTAHVALQSSPFHTRRLVLHELTHAVQDRVVPVAARRRIPAWYREGLAEWFGWHRRTKDGVEFGALDVVAPGHRPLAARALALGEGYDPWAVMGAAPPVDYTAALAVVAGLLGAEDAEVRDAFRHFERDVARRGAHRGVPEPLAACREAAEAALRAYWESFEPRFVAETRGFDAVPDGFVARAVDGEAARITARAAARRLAATIVPTGDGVAGVEARIGDGDAGVFAYAGSDGLHVRIDGRALGPYPIAGTSATPVRLEARLSGGHLVVGASRGRRPRVVTLAWPPPGTEVAAVRLGLRVERGAARFRDVVAD